MRLTHLFLLFCEPLVFYLQFGSLINVWESQVMYGLQIHHIEIYAQFIVYTLGLQTNLSCEQPWLCLLML